MTSLSRSRYVFIYFVAGLVAAVAVPCIWLAVYRAFIYYPQNVTIRLDKNQYLPGEKMHIRFSEFLSPFGEQDFSITLNNCDHPDSHNIRHAWLDKGARDLVWEAPSHPWSYKMILWVRGSGYVKKLDQQFISVGNNYENTATAEAVLPEYLQVKFKVFNRIANSGGSFEMEFSKPLDSMEGENFDIELVPPHSPDDNSWGLVHSKLDKGTTKATVSVKGRYPGRYELRLIARAPYNRTLVHRETVIIVPEEVGAAETTFDFSKDADLDVTFELAKKQITIEERPRLVFSTMLVPNGRGQYYVKMMPTRYFGHGYNEANTEIPSFITAFDHDWYILPGEFEISLSVRRDNGFFKTLHSELIEIVAPAEKE